MQRDISRSVIKFTDLLYEHLGERLHCLVNHLRWDVLATDRRSHSCLEGLQTYEVDLEQLVSAGYLGYITGSQEELLGLAYVLRLQRSRDVVKESLGSCLSVTPRL